jgi:putative ABC transport system permease protein
MLRRLCRRGGSMLRLQSDLQWAARSLRRNRGFSLIVVFTIAVGIAVNLLLVALADGLLFHPTNGAATADRVAVYSTSERHGMEVDSYRDFVDFREQSSSFERLAAWKSRPADVTLGGSTERLRAMMVSAGYCELLALTPLRGRFIAPGEDRVAGGSLVVLLTESFWRNRFGGSDDAIGRDLLVNGHPFRIIGVLPSGFHGTSVSEPADIFVPMTAQPLMMPGSGNLLDKRGWSGIYVIGKLKAGVTLGQGRANLETIASNLARQFPDSNAGRGVAVIPLARAALPPGTRAVVLRSTTVLLILGICFLALISVNVANLLLVRGIARAREVAIRLALGAGRLRIARQFVAEALILSATGTISGALLCWISLRVLRTSVPMLSSVTFGAGAIMAAPLLALFTGLVSATAPALVVSDHRIQNALRSGARGSKHSRRLASTLVVMQVAISLFLLVSAGLFVKTLINLRHVAIGYETEHLITTELQLSGRNLSPVLAQSYFSTVLARLRALPGVEGAALSNLAPFSGNSDTMGAWPEGAATRQPAHVAAQVVGDRYFRTLGVPILAGREFDEHDDLTARGSAKSPTVCVVNQALARSIWHTDDAVGRRISIAGPSGPFMEVVGVVADSRYALRGSAAPTLYAAQAQVIDLFPDLSAEAAVFVRIAGNPVVLLPDLRTVVREADPAVPLGAFRTVEALRDAATVQEKTLSISITVLSILALMLAGLGLYGVISFAVVQRLRELAIRIALGATGGDIALMIMRRGAMLTALGFAAGSLALFSVQRLMAGFLFETRAADPAVWIAVTAVVATTMAAATYVPCRRASRIDPVVILKCE